MAQGGFSVKASRLLLSSIEESNVSMIIDWLRRQSFLGGQNTSMAAGIQPCGTAAAPA